MPFQMKGFMNKSQPVMSTKPGTLQINVSNLNLAQQPLNITATPTTNPSVVPTQTDQEERYRAEYESARKTLEDALEKIKETSAPSISIEGIALSTGTSPVVSSVGSQMETLSIVQDAISDSVLQKIQQTSMGPQPVILSSVKVPSISVRDMDDAIEVSQFERQIVKEAIVKGVKDIMRQDPRGTGTAAKEASLKDIDALKKQVNAIAYMQDTANIAATGLDITRLSSQIMQRATDTLGPIVNPSEVSNKALPKSLDEYISLTFPTDSLKLGVDGYLTNTSRLVVLAQDMLLAALSCHPTVLQHFSRNPTLDENLASTSIFTPPGAYGYNPDGPGGQDMVMIPTVSQLFSPNERSIVSQFQSSKTIESPRQVRGVLNNGNIDTVTEAWDTVLHLITCISNEMIMSAGIGRLIGSPLGTRFLEMSTQNVGQYNPLDRVLGFSPTDGPDKISEFFKSGPSRPGSFLDYLALGEEAADEKFVVMPFEVNTVISNGKYYVSGKKYFIDLAIQSEGDAAVTQRGALKRFASDFNTFTNDMSSYLTELLALDVNTSLSPQMLLARVLQDFNTVLSALDRPEDSINVKSATAAGLFALAGYSPDKATAVENQKTIILTVSDILKMSVVKALKQFDRLSKDATYALSNENMDYQTSSAPPGDNPESNLEKSVFALLELSPDIADDYKLSEALTTANTTKSSDVSRTRYAYNFTDNLYDDEFSSSTNIINLIARTIREIQKESLNLAQRNGAKIDYRNSGKRTFLSNCDDDRFVDVVCELYSRIAYLLLPMGIYKQRTSSAFEFVADINTQQVRSCNAVISSIVASLINGQEIDAVTLQQDSLVDPETTLSVGGDNTIVSKAAYVADAAARAPSHRYYIKSSLKILEAVSAGVAASSAKMTAIFDILGGNVKRDKLKDLDLELYDLFVTNKSQNEDFLANMSEYQTNLCAAAVYNYISGDEVFLRRDIDVSRPERLAVRDYIKSVYEKGDVDDLQIVSVGLPSGILESLYRSAINVDESNSQQAAIAGSEGQKLGRLVRIEMDRYEGAHFNTISSVETDVLATPPSPNEFDPEIFILPDSISYDPSNKPPTAVTVMDAIFQTTTFYRIRNGTVIEKTLGQLVEPGQERVYINALRSYLLDIFLYETAKVRYADGITPYGVPGLSKEGYSLIREISSDSQLSRAVMNTIGFAKMFDEKTYTLKEKAALKTLLTPKSVDVPAEFSDTDVYFTSVLSSIVPLAKKSGVIVNRPFERVYNIIYDESIVRNSLSGDDIARKIKRKQFDIFTLSFRVSYGGSL